MVSAQQALRRLRDGNRRFAADQRHDDARRQTRPGAVAAGQAPFAVILGCSDSRVPAEFVFDQGLGDLFVVRVAGNIVTPSQIGSVEYAAVEFGTRLVLVLGHSACGAIQATLQQLRQPGDIRPDGVRSIVDTITPSVEPVLRDEQDADADTLVAMAVQANIRASVEQLRKGSELLAELERDDGLVIMGAEYSLDTGLVEFFDDVPQTKKK